MLTRYADAAVAYRDPSLSSDKQRMFRPKFGDTPLFEHHTTSLVFNDAPYHTRVRALIAGALKPQAVKAMEPSLVALINQLLDRVEAMGEFDIVGDFAMQIPLEVIGNLLRVPRDEREPLRDWSLNILGALEPTLTPEEEAAGNRSVTEFMDYLDRLIAARRKNLSDDPSDVLSALIRGDETGGKLSRKELLHNCIFLLNAGHETTTNLISSGAWLMMTRPSERQRLVRNPELAKSAVDEILRYESPNQLGNREVVNPFSIGDLILEPGAILQIGIGAANRDPAQFDRPDEFDISRRPNGHFAFATGAHACIGMSLARLEGRLALDALVRRFPKLRPLDARPAWRRRARFRGLESLRVAVDD